MQKLILTLTAMVGLTMTSFADVGWTMREYAREYGPPVKKMGQVSTALGTASVYVYQDGYNNIVVVFDEESGTSVQETIAPTPR